MGRRQEFDSEEQNEGEKHEEQAEMLGHILHSRLVGEVPRQRYAQYDNEEEEKRSVRCRTRCRASHGESYWLWKL